MLQGKLYEELLLGQLPRETLIEMSQKYKTEKKALEQKSQELQLELDRLTAKAKDIRNWLCVVREYMSGTFPVPNSNTITVAVHTDYNYQNP